MAIKRSTQFVLIIFCLIALSIALIIPFIINKFNWSLTEKVKWSLSEAGVSRDIVIDSNNNIITLCYDDYFDAEGYIIYEINIFKYDKFGNKLWRVKWLEGKSAFPIAITVDSDDNIYAVGSYKEEDYLKYDVIILKYSKNGNLEWSRRWDKSERDQPRGIDCDSENNVYITGEIVNETENRSDIFLLKYDTNGTLQWSKCITEGENESGRAIIIDNNDFIYLGLSKNSNESALIKFNKLGNLMNKTKWMRDFGCSIIKMDKDVNNNIYMASRGNLKSFNNKTKVILNFSITEDTRDVAIDNYRRIYIAHSCSSYSDCCIDIYGNSGRLFNRITYTTSGYHRLTSIAIDNLDDLLLLGDNWNTILLVKISI